MAAILWKKELSSIIRPISDGGKRLQCIEFALENGEEILLISAYLNSTGSKESILEY